MQTSRNLKQVCGHVVAVNPLRLRLTIKRLLLPMVFQVAASAQITTPTQSRATLGALQIGDWVEISYEVRGKHRVARHIVQAG